MAVIKIEVWRRWIAVVAAIGRPLIRWIVIARIGVVRVTEAVEPNEVSVVMIEVMRIVMKPVVEAAVKVMPAEVGYAYVPEVTTAHMPAPMHNTALLNRATLMYRSAVADCALMTAAAEMTSHLSAAMTAAARLTSHVSAPGVSAKTSMAYSVSSSAVTSTAASAMRKEGWSKKGTHQHCERDSQARDPHTNIFHGRRPRSSDRHRLHALIKHLWNHFATRRETPKTANEILLYFANKQALVMGRLAFL